MGTVWKDTVWKGMKRNNAAWDYKSTMFESDENWVFESRGKWRITGIPSLKVTKLK